MFKPWIIIFTWLRAHVKLPKGWAAFKPHFNFIRIHYIYLLCMTLVTSVVIYGAGNMQYIDALFFASGCATQSGLNTIDVNKLELYQQVCVHSLLSAPLFSRAPRSLTDA